MTGLILPARFNRQPSRPTRIDRSNEIGARLVSALTPSRSTVDLCSARTLTLDSATTAVVGSDGLEWQNSSYSTPGIYFVGGWDGVVPISEGITFFARIFIASIGTRQTLLADWVAAGSDVSLAVEITAPGNWQIYGDAVSGVSGSAATAGWQNVVIAQQANGQVDIWSNGVNVLTGSSASGRAAGYTARWLGSGAYVGAAISWIGRASLLAIGRGAADRTVAAKFAQNPWQIFKAPPRRLWIGASAGSGSTYDLDAADSITATDAATQQLTAPAAATDAASAADSASNLGVLTRSASDAAAATDAATVTLTIPTSASDAAAATDASSSASAVNSAATDAIAAADAATQLAVLPAAASDAAAVTDSATNLGVLTRAATDAAAASDAATGLRVTLGSASDAVTATDTAAQVSAANVTATDAISAADAATVQAVLVGIVSDGFSAIDAATLLAGIYNLAAADVLSLLDAALADGGVQYARAPQGAGQDLINPTGRRSPVISGNRPGNINTARPANRGGRRT